jgi:hypothetical protein
MNVSDKEKLCNALFKLLQSHPQGLSEYELLKRLQASDKNAFTQLSFRDSYKLFHSHFILFHLLYTLREKCWQDGSAHLVINPLKILLLPYAKRNTRFLTHRDQLRDYYLDLSNLKNTTEEDVANLLTNFWKGFQAGDQRQQALEILELQDPVDAPTIKQQYRRLAMRHHPDRGGDKKSLQAINDAMSVLKRCGVK